MSTNNKKPPIYDGGCTLFLTIAYPPNPTASAVVHKHLLDQFDPKSFKVITAFFPGAKKSLVPKEVRQHVIYISFEFISSKIHRMLAAIQQYSIPMLLRWYIFLYKPKRIIIGYPDLFWLDICSKIAIKKKIPFVPYLHDTVLEATYFGRSKLLAKEVQDRIFTKSHQVAVMSEGMRKLYLDKYSMNSIAWEHIYPEAPLAPVLEKEERAHWSGDIYHINQHAVVRFNTVLQQLGYTFSISNGKSREALSSIGISGNHIRKEFIPERKDYLKQLSTAKFLLLGLNYSDECTVHEDELATIFSTKTPEYLGSGSLIIFNGPKHYFLAKFLLEHQCGVVIDSREPNVMFNRLKEIAQNYHSYLPMIENARNTLSIFNGQRIANKLVQTLND